MPDIAAFLRSVKLPVMPEVAQALIRTLSDDQADVATVTAIIAKDPGLTATLLRMANSALFGLSRSVTTLDNAVSVVGTAQIRARALAICMSNAFVFPPGLNRLEFWRSSMVCAGYSRWLAAQLGMDEQQAWLSGMMLRLGELLIAQSLPDAVVQIEIQPCGPGERWLREREQTGFDEGQLAAEIAQRWDFPDTIASALRASGQPTHHGGTPLATVVHLAALMTDQVVPPSQLLDHLPFVPLQLLKLDVEHLRDQVPDPESFSDISMLQD
ncbi:MAG: HDOD domain-containing protein [Rhodoferax sp.]